MKLPKLEKPDRYEGLYVFDFGDHAAVGYTAEEVAELLDSEKYREGKVYKIYRAYPDGRLELKAIPAASFQLEAGMFFYCADEKTARDDFQRLTDLAISLAPPCRAKVHLARYSDEQFVVAMVYPAEYDGEVSRWLLEGDYRTAGQAEGGVGAVERYYDNAPDVLERHQLFSVSESIHRSGDELLACVGMAVQR
jgi:hypothetical protein